MKNSRTILLAVLAAIAAFVIALTGGQTGQHAATRPTPAPLSAPTGEMPSEAGTLEEGPLPAALVVRDFQLAQTLLAPSPAAGAQTYSCPTLYGGHLWKDRPAGITATEFIVHYTAGLGTAESVDQYFRNTRAASVTYLLEPNGHCRQEVPEGKEPWTQLNANPTSISVEIVTTGWNLTRAQWLAMPIFKHHILADLMRDSMRRNGIPLRRVDPQGCTFTPGWTDHDHLECGNDHVDVSPGCARLNAAGTAHEVYPHGCTGFPFDVLQKQLVEQDKIDALYVRVRRSHRIVHAKLDARCYDRHHHALHTPACGLLHKRNGELHTRYPKVLATG